MKNLLTGVLMCTVALISFAQQDEPFYGENDPEAQKLLKEISKKYKAFTSITAQFSQRFEAGEAVDERESGTVVLKNSKFKIKYDNGDEYYCDSKATWFYNKDDNEVTITAYEPEEDEINPSQIFTMYENGFLYKLAESSKSGTDEINIIELTPTSNKQKKTFFKVKLTVNKTKQEIIGLMVLNKDGSRLSFELKNMKANESYADSYFQFNAESHKDVEVVDLR